MEVNGSSKYTNHNVRKYDYRTGPWSKDLSTYQFFLTLFTIRLSVIDKISHRSAWIITFSSLSMFKLLGLPVNCLLRGPGHHLRPRQDPGGVWRRRHRIWNLLPGVNVIKRFYASVTHTSLFWHSISEWERKFFEIDTKCRRKKLFFTKLPNAPAYFGIGTVTKKSSLVTSTLNVNVVKLFHHRLWGKMCWGV